MKFCRCHLSMPPPSQFLLRGGSYFKTRKNAENFDTLSADRVTRIASLDSISAVLSKLPYRKIAVRGQKKGVQYDCVAK